MLHPSNDIEAFENASLRLCGREATCRKAFPNFTPHLIFILCGMRIKRTRKSTEIR